MPLLEAAYINHEGKKLKFGKESDGLFLNEHDLLNFSWNVQTRGNRIISVNRKGVKEHTLPFVIAAQTETQAYKLANDLFSVCEADLQANQRGRLVVNGYNLKCFIRGQDYSEWSETSKCLKISARVIRDSIWYGVGKWQIKAKVKAVGGLNARKGAGTGFARVKTYPNGSTVTIVEKNKDLTWGKTTDGLWINLNYVEVLY